MSGQCPLPSPSGHQMPSRQGDGRTRRSKVTTTLFQDGAVNARKEIQRIHRAFLDELAHAVQFAALGDRHARLGAEVELPPYRDPLAFGIAPALEADVRK